MLQHGYAATFKNPTLINTSFDPYGVSTADVNHDGTADLLYVDGTRSYSLHALLGNGDGTFTHGQDVPLPTGMCSYQTCVLNLVDVTNDGNVDVVIGGSGTSQVQLVVVAGNADGTFQLPVVSVLKSANGNYPNLNCYMGIGDVNGDGAADVVIPDAATASLYIALGNNQGGFTLGSTLLFYFTGQVNAYLLDLNGDGPLDIVVFDTIGAHTHVLIGNGDGTFKPDVSYLSFATAFADMDGDGHPDLVADVYPGQIEILRGNADGTFGAALIVATVATADLLVGAGDFNADGIVDLTFITPTGVGVLLGEGNLTYGTRVLDSLSGKVGAAFHLSGDVTQADFNADGHLDVVMGVEGGVAILTGNGDGTFLSGDWYDLTQLVGAISTGDFNGDHKTDIAVAMPASFPRLLLGNGSGSFTLAADQNHAYGSQTPSTILEAGDFNGDGKLDLDSLVSDTQYPYGQTFVLFGGSNGNFVSPLGIAAGPSVLADVNDDGRADLVSVSTTLDTFLGRTDGTFQLVSTPLQYATLGVAAVGDLNRDGKLDVLTFEFSTLRLWLGKGDGSFTNSSIVGGDQLFYTSQMIAIADMDNDGSNDLIVTPNPNPAAPPGPLMIFYGNGDGTFQNPALLPLSHRYGQLVISDVNQDNNRDLVLSDGAGIAVITNLGARLFNYEEHYVAGQSILGLEVADVNGDGFPDIVTSNGGGTTAAVLLNQPNGSGQGFPSDGVFHISPEPSGYAQAISLTMTMSAPPGSGTGTPTGSVTFNVDGAFLTTVNLVQGTGTYNYSPSLLPGTHTFIGTYNGDETYRAESFAVLHTVVPPTYVTQTSIAATPSNVYASQTVQFTATVSSTPPAPSGWVTFFDGQATLGAQQIDGRGIAVLDTALLAAGTHSITAKYQGFQDPTGVQAIYSPSTSASTSVTVNSVATSTTVSASDPNPISGSVVTFTTNVTSGAGIPFGGVTFYDGALPLGTSALQYDGSGRFSTASLNVGTHNITVAFNSNAVFAQSISPILAINVAVPPGNEARTVVSVAAVAGPTEGSSLLTAKVRSLSGLPSGRVTFIDNGVLLGASETEESGTARLIVATLGSGTHQLFASFAGTASFAPTASPALTEQWPANDLGFRVDLGSDSLQARGDGAQRLAVNIVPIGGFHQSVRLSCGEGLPGGYTCSFSSTVLNGGGIVYLSIQPTAETSQHGKKAQPWRETALGLLLFSCAWMACTRRRISHVTILTLLGAMLLMTACGTSSSPARPELRILSIRAESGSGVNEIIHSAQVQLEVLRPR